MQQAGHDEALAITQFNCGLGAAHDQAWNFQIVERDRRGRVDLAYFRCDLKIDDAVIQNRRGEIEAHAKLLEFHRDLAVFSGHRNREFAAGEEAGRIARQCRQVRFGEPAGNALLLQCLHQQIDIHAVIDQAAENIAEGQGPGDESVGDGCSDCRIGGHQPTCGTVTMLAAAMETKTQFLVAAARSLDEADFQRNLR